jgi:lipooligosaccharide transport system ATP-binding protein
VSLPGASPLTSAEPTPGGAPMVRARALTKVFGQFTAVDAIDFDVQPGEAFGFLGPNGAGKSSTMRMIGCVAPVTSGTLTILGMDPATQGPQIRARLGVVPQQDTLDNELTVRDNLYVYGRYFGMSRARLRPKIEELLDFAQLTERASSKVEPLSGGMKRRLTIARSLISEPDLLLLDEPTTGLDPQARHLLWDRLYRLKQQGVTLVLTTHYMDEAEQLCDRLVVMDGGRIVAEGSPQALIAQYSTREVAELRFPPGLNGEAAALLCGVIARGRLPAADRPEPDRMSGRITVVEYWFLDARRYWRSVIMTGTITPLLYVLALGVGLGSVVNHNGGGAALGVPYLVFVAPALLVASAVQIGASDASYPILSKFKWERSFHGMAATPLTPAQICDATLIWIAIRLTLTSSVYLAIVATFGATERWLAVLAVPAATLCGLAIAAPVAAYAATRVNEGQGFNVLARFIIIPMFLFSGTFYPVDRLPDWGRWVAYATPLWNGTQLARAAAIGGQPAWEILVHITYLLAMVAVGTVLARRAFRARVAR